MTTVPNWFLAPIKTSYPFKRDFYICTDCGGQSCGGTYASTCRKCHGVQSNPPRQARSEYLCNTCAHSSKRFVCECDYPVVRSPPVPSPIIFTPNPPPVPDPCCCDCDWCNFLYRCVCCCLDCKCQSSSCEYCCTSTWNCCGAACYWSWCGCSCSKPPT